MLLLTVAFAFIASPILALASELEIPALLGRQAPGTPEYDCHASCGMNTLI
jgi:hypothetical protein